MKEQIQQLNQELLNIINRFEEYTKCHVSGIALTAIDLGQEKITRSVSCQIEQS